MAQALSIVGEEGIHGFEYNPATELMTDGRLRQSRKGRWSILAARSFSSREFEEYMILAWRFGYVERSKFQELDWTAGRNKSSYDLEDEVIRLTQMGWEYIEAYDDPVLERWFRQIVENVPVVVTSVSASLLGAYVLTLFG